MGLDPGPALDSEWIGELNAGCEATDPLEISPEKVCPGFWPGTPWWDMENVWAPYYSLIPCSKFLKIMGIVWVPLLGVPGITLQKGANLGGDRLVFQTSMFRGNVPVGCIGSSFQATFFGGYVSFRGV